MFNCRIKTPTEKQPSDLRPMSYMLENTDEYLEADVEMVAADESVVMAHRAVLSTRSEWFACFFKRMLDENPDSKIRMTIPQAPNKDVLKIAIKMVYDNEANVEDVTMAARLMHVMDFMCIKHLKAELVKVLDAAEIDDDNVGIIMHTAEQFDIARVHKRALTYVSNNDPKGEAWESACREHPDVLFAANVAKRLKKKTAE